MAESRNLREFEFPAVDNSNPKASSKKQCHGARLGRRWGPCHVKNAALLSEPVRCTALIVSGEEAP